MKYSNHSEYYNKKGVEVPSVTTILKILNKPKLVDWANYLGFKRMNVKDVLSEKSAIGTEVHEMIEKYLTGEKYIYKPSKYYTKAYLGSFIDKFITWYKRNDVIYKFLETKFVSDKFGGTVDFYGDINGKKTVLDFKTSSKFYSSMFLQLAAYTYMLEENGYEVEQVGILLVHTNNTEERYYSREQIQKYIEVIIILSDLFHAWFEVSIEDGWERIIDKPKDTFKPKRVIVAGGRDYNDYDNLVNVLNGIVQKGDIIVSGGAKGADLLGERYAIERNYEIEKYLPEYDGTNEKYAPILRNNKMGDVSDILVAFWDGKSNGTKYMIEYMQSLGKRVAIIRYEKEELIDVL